MRYVGMDVHKRFAKYCVLDKAGRQVDAGEVACEREALETLCRERLGRDDQVALEASTNTWAVVDLISPHVGRVVVSNPMRTKAIAWAKVKTDKIDAEVLAQLLRCDYLPDVWQPDEKTRRLRQLTTLRASLTADRTRIKNRVQALLAGRMIRCPYATLFAKRSLAWLASLELPDDDRFQLDGQLRLLRAVDRERASVDERLRAAAEEEPRAKLLMTLPGVSHATALTLIAALGDVSRFRDGAHAASYLGLVPTTRQSGEKCYHGRISKAGDAQARWMLTQGVQHLARQPGPLGAFFRRVAQRKRRQVAITAAARKVVTIAYLMLKNNEPYRYATAAPLRRKLGELRPPGERRRPRAGTLAEACRDAGLEAPRGYDELPAGERRMLVQTGTDAFARRVTEGSETG